MEENVKIGAQKDRRNVKQNDPKQQEFVCAFKDVLNVHKSED